VRRDLVTVRSVGVGAVLVLGVCLGSVLGLVAALVPGPATAAPAIVAASASVRPARADLPEPQPSAEASRQEADDILSGAEYQEPPESALGKVFEWIFEQLAKVQPGSAFGAVGWVLIALLVGVAVFMLSRLRRTSRVAGDDVGYEFDLEDRRPPKEWVADAERFESRGEWKHALRCRFRALLGDLILIGTVRDLPGRTTGEYRLEVRRNAPGAAAAFSDASRLFEEAWYGDEPTGPEENQRFQALPRQAVDASRAATASARATATEVPA
jgi:hypothetical protein